ncbi:hypothetical protein GEMRC1_000220 [Eukaryota sp. GEM-RC1]
MASIIHIDSSPEYIAAVSSDNCIIVTDLSLRPLVTLPGFPNGQVSAVAFSKVEPHILAAVSEDSPFVFIYDLKSSPEPVSKIRISPGALLSCIAFHPTSHMFAVGSSIGMIYLVNFLDGKPVIKEFDFIHTDTVVSLSFIGENLILSGSLDNLITLFDFSLEDEDDCIINVFNADSSVSRCEMFPGIAWGITCTETLRVWSSSNETPFEPVFSLDKLREQLNVDYLLYVFPLNTELVLFSGNHSGVLTISSLSNLANSISIPVFEDSIRYCCYSSAAGGFYMSSDDGCLSFGAFEEGKFKKCRTVKIC